MAQEASLLCPPESPPLFFVPADAHPVRTSVSTRTPPSPLPPPPTALATPDLRRSIPPSLVRYQASPDPTSPATRPGAKRPSSGEDLTPLAKRPLRNLPDIGAERDGHLALPHVDTTPASPRVLPTLPHALLATLERSLSPVPEEDEDPPCTPPAVSVCPFECQTPSRGHRIPHVTDDEVRSHSLEALLPVAEQL